MPKQKWQGTYTQDDNQGEMVFAYLKIKEESVTGAGSDDVGKFEIEGTVEGGKVSFGKQYVGAHLVAYNGEINNGRTKMWGHWDINDGDLVGEFQMRAVDCDDDPKFRIQKNGKVMQRKKEEWIHIGDHACQIQTHLKSVYILSDDEHEVWKWNYGEPHSWTKIGEDCKYLYVVEKKVYMKKRSDKLTYEYTGKDDVWENHPMLFQPKDE